MFSEIKIARVESFTTRVKLHPEKGLITILAIETKMAPADIARLLNMQKQGPPISIIIGSDQLLFDLEITSSAVPAVLPLSGEAPNGA
jgi:hypothetical protein